MSRFVKYHNETNEVALFESDGKYWIGAYGPFLTHQNGEPMYYYVDGYFDSEEDGLQALETSSKDIF
jgi:hypothetical protein